VSRYSHVAVGVSIKRGRNEKRRIEAGRDFPTIAEIGRLLAAANDDTKQRALLLILAFTGLRASEFRGLRWSDIDLKACELHVRQRADEYNVIGAPKSDASVRTIPIDPDVMAPALKEWKLKCPPSDFVFPTRTGKPQDYNGIRDGSIDPAMRAAKLIGKDGEPKYTPHASVISLRRGASIRRRAGAESCHPSRCNTCLGIPPYP
jgi:integrase